MGSVEIAETMSLSGSESGSGAVNEGSVEAVVKKLDGVDPQLARSLAALHGAPDSVVAATITAYRFGTRTLLDSLGLLEEGGDETGRLRISDRGMQVISACAERYPQSDTNVEAALEAASALLEHSGRAGRLKVR